MWTKSLKMHYRAYKYRFGLQIGIKTNLFHIEPTNHSSKSSLTRLERAILKRDQLEEKIKETKEKIERVTKIDQLKRENEELKNRVEKSKDNAETIKKFATSSKSFKAGCYILGNHSSLQERIYRFEKRLKKCKESKRDIVQLIQIPSKVLHADDIEKKLPIYLKEKSLIKEKVIKQYGFPKISKVMIKALEDGYYTFESLEGKDINVMLVVRKLKEGLEVGYFGGKRSKDENKSTDRAAIAQLKIESNKVFNFLLIKGEMQKLQRRSYSLEDFPESAKDYSEFQDVFFWLI